MSYVIHALKNINALCKNIYTVGKLKSWLIAAQKKEYFIILMSNENKSSQLWDELCFHTFLF